MKNFSNVILFACLSLMGALCSCTSDEGKIIKYKDVTYKVSGGKAYAIGPEQRWANSSLIIKSVIPGYQVEGVADSAFFKEGNLKKVIIEEGIKCIGKYAFAECSHLEEVTLPTSVKEIEDGVFKCCRFLSKVNFTDSLVSIGDSAFYDIDFPELVFPPHLRKIGASAFEDISLYKSSTLCFPNDLVYIGDRAFRNSYFSSLLLPQNLEFIGEEAFANGGDLKSLYIPEKVSFIGAGAFANICIDKIDISPNNEKYIICGGCLLSGDRKVLRATSKEALKNDVLVIPEGVESLEKCGVYLSNYYRAKRISLPNSLKRISKGAIRIHGYVQFASIYIPKNVELIEAAAFDGCKSVVAYEVDPANKYFSSQEGVLFDKSKTRLLKYPSGNTRKKYILPSSVQSVDSVAFSNCEYLYSLNTANLKTLRVKMCYYCRKLEEVICPNVDSIMRWAVFWCGDVIVCHVGENVKYIDAHGLDHLRTLYCQAENPPYINGETLSAEKHSWIYVPAQSVYAYQRDEKWGKLNIVPIQ